MNAYAQDRLGKAWFPSAKAALVGLGADVISPIARFMGFNDTADHLNHFADAYEQAAGKLDEEGWTPSIVKRGLRGVTRTLPPMILEGFAGGPYAPIAGIAVGELNKGITEAKDAGLEGSAARNYAIRKAAISSVPYALLQRFGLGHYQAVRPRGQQGSSYGARGGAETGRDHRRPGNPQAGACRLGGGSQQQALGR